MQNLSKIFLGILTAAVFIAGCGLGDGSAEKPRLSLFVAFDISGSFMKSGHYENSIDFLARYLYAHLNGLGGLEVPNALFVSSIGGASANEPKTFYPRQLFENKSVDEIAQKLREVFPKGTENPYTDYNAFFEQVAMTVRNRKLVLRPVSIVMVSDGIPDVKKEGRTDFRSIALKPLEGLARNITLRLLYTNAEVGKNWQTKVPRSRVKVWTQDAEVMTTWSDPKIYSAEKPVEEQERFFSWVKDNVDFGVSARRVD
ncbi:MAG: hypothetical protein HY562_05975 [Ignavibacteriales bacterium]|nr:hypothetical protein [Ignavibacteriales bacterium]